MTHTTPRSILALATACMLMAIAASSYAQAQRTSQVTDDAQATSSRTAPAPSSPKPFEDLDTNGDGAISKDEAYHEAERCLRCYRLYSVVTAAPFDAATHATA